MLHQRPIPSPAVAISPENAPVANLVLPYSFMSRFFLPLCPQFLDFTHTWLAPPIIAGHRRRASPENHAGNSVPSSFPSTDIDLLCTVSSPCAPARNRCCTHLSDGIRESNGPPLASPSLVDVLLPPIDLLRRNRAAIDSGIVDLDLSLSLIPRLNLSIRSQVS